MLYRHKNLDISLLPPRARLKLLDYYDFLKKKYVPQKTVETASRFNGFLNQPVIIKKFKTLSREQLHER